MFNVPEQMREKLKADIIFPKRMGRPEEFAAPGGVDRLQSLLERRKHPPRRSPALPPEMRSLPP